MDKIIRFRADLVNSIHNFKFHSIEILLFR